MLRTTNGTVIGFGEEMDWGNPASRTTWFRAVSADLRMKVDRKPRPVLATGGSGVANNYFNAGVTVQGTLVFVAAFEGVGLILKHALYKDPTSVGSGPYTHTYEMQGPQPAGGLTVEIILGDSGLAEVFSGCRINKMTLEFKTADVVKITLDVIGKSSGGRVSAGTPTYTANDGIVDVVYDMVGSLQWNGGEYPLNSLKVNVDNKLSVRPRLGSLYTQDPKLSSMREISLEGEWELTDDTLYTGMLNGTTGDAVIAIAGKEDYAETLTASNCVVTTADDPHTQMGVTKQTFKLAARDPGIVIEMINSQSSATAN